jgi:hypothetical protein
MWYTDILNLAYLKTVCFQIVQKASMSAGVAMTYQRAAQKVKMPVRVTQTGDYNGKTM